MRLVEPVFADPTLFLVADEQLFGELQDATYELHALAKAAEPVIDVTEPWEGNRRGEGPGVQSDPMDGTVQYDPHTGLFHMWYRSHNGLVAGPSEREPTAMPPRSSWICYATSRDGLTWDKPALGRVPYEQRFDTNMVRIAVPPVKTSHLNGVMPDYRPGREGKFVATCYSHFDDPLYERGITFLESDNGFDWVPHFPPALPMDGDAHFLMWDPSRQCYICTTRSYVHGRMVHRLQLRGYHELRNKRHVAIASSRDLVHWTPMQTVLEVDEHDPENAQMYTMYVLPYGHGHLGFVQMFYPNAEMTSGPLDVQVTFSRDLLTWQRIGDRRPFLARGEAGTWDQAHVSLYGNPPNPEGDTLRFWYGGKDKEHWQNGQGAVGTGTLRRDGFACIAAADGSVTTAPFDLVWATKMALSADVDSGGSIRLEVLDAESLLPLAGCSSTDCDPLTTSGTRLQVSFTGSTFIRHTGRIRFRIHLKSARLYALKATNCTPVPIP